MKAESLKIYKVFSGGGDVHCLKISLLRLRKKAVETLILQMREETAR